MVSIVESPGKDEPFGWGALWFEKLFIVRMIRVPLLLQRGFSRRFSRRAHGRLWGRAGLRERLGGRPRGSKKHLFFRFRGWKLLQLLPWLATCPEVKDLFILAGIAQVHLLLFGRMSALESVFG